MAKSIVAQIPTKCKVKVNPYLDELAESLKAKPELHYRRAGEALSMTNEDAIEFLRSVGFAQIIPGTHFAPERDYAQFFNTDWSCLHNYLYRYKLNSKENPKEAFSVNLKYFFKVANLLDKGEVVSESTKGGLFDFHFKNTDSHYVTRDGWSVRLISARVAVAMIPIMAQQNGKFYKRRIRALNDELVNFMRKKREEAKAIAESEAAAAEARAIAEAEAKKAAELKAAIAEESLYQLIKRAVAEVMSGAKISLTAPAENT